MLYMAIICFLFYLTLSMFFLYSYFAQFGAGHLDIITKLIFHIAFWPGIVFGILRDELSKVMFNVRFHLVNLAVWQLLFFAVWVVLIKIVRMRKDILEAFLKKTALNFIAGLIIIILIILIITAVK